jgi:RNA polymerase subunit RPABC4/transcription elongation factor Spt4
VICPRCGTADLDETAVRIEIKPLCPNCQKVIAKGMEECPHCRQLLCPECLAAVGEEDTVCPACGVEFELFCPECERPISATAERCPSCGLVF